MGKQQNLYAPLLKVLTGMIVIFTPSCNSQGASFTCPYMETISPCTCRQFINYYFLVAPYGEGITIDCVKANLSDFQMSRILEAFLAPGVSPVIEILGSFNQLTKVPKQIPKFPVLSRLNLNYNRISDIQSEDGKPMLSARFSNNETAIEISLTNNQITRIPSNVFNIPSAKANVKLYLTDNRIRSISSNAFMLPSCPAIWIYLSRNQLSDLPAWAFNFPNSMRNVEIALDSNQFRAVPSAAFYFPLSKYARVNLSSNKITLIQVNAFNFMSTTYSQIINLSRNNITTIPCGTFNSLPNDVSIILSYNQITAVPSCAFIYPSSLSINLYLENNMITSIAPGAFNFPSADFILLTLDNNKISVIPPYTFAQGRYERLSMAHNQLKRLDQSIIKNLLGKMSFLDSLGNFFSLYGFSSLLDITGNPIDCSTDPCHLAWLLKSANSSRLLARDFRLIKNEVNACQ